MAGAIHAGSDAEAGARDVFQIVARAMQSPDTIEKLQKQNFNIVANKSLAEAQTWLADGIKHWEHITKAVEIDVAQ